MAKTYRDYDEDADVLYLTVGKPTRDARSFEDERGLIWRQSLDGAWIGVTVPDFEFYWGPRRAELDHLVSERLSVPLTERVSA